MCLLGHAAYPRSLVIFLNGSSSCYYRYKEQGPYFFVWRAQNIIKSNAQSIFVFTQNTRSKRRLNLLRFFSGDINMINPNHSRKKVVQLQPLPAQAHIRKRHKSGYQRKFYFISFLSNKLTFRLLSLSPSFHLL